MQIDSKSPVAVNFGGIYMAQWIKMTAGSVPLITLEKVESKCIVTLVLRRGRRAFENEYDVIQNMTCKSGSGACTHSLLTVDFDLSTFQEGLNMVSRSMVLVGVHGAGLTNLIFLPSGGALVELRLAKTRAAYSQLCRSFGKSYFEFKGTTMVSPPSQAWSVQDDRDFLVRVVEPEKLGRVVSNIAQAVFTREPSCC